MSVARRWSSTGAGLADNPPHTGAAIADVRATILRTGVENPDLDGSSHTLLVEIEDVEGVVGIGEADSSSAAARELVTMSDEQVWNCGFSSVLLGQDPVQIGSLWDKLAEATLYQGQAGISRHTLAAVDVALHDLAGKQLGRPSFHLLGGARRDHLTPYATIWVAPEPGATLSELADRTLSSMEKAVSLGFLAVKMEVVFGALASDRDLVSCIREGRATVGDDVELLVDFGYRWSDWRDPLWVLTQVEDCRIWLAEAALSPTDLEGHARLASRVQTRIGGAELASTLEECRNWLEIGHIDVLQADITRCGGLTEMQRVAQLAAMHGALVVPHCWKSGINAAAARHFQAATSNAPFIELLTAELFNSPLRAELVAPEPVLDAGRLALPALPGLGVDLVPETVARYAVDSPARS